MNRIAIPIEDGKLSEHFERCEYYEIFEIDEKHAIANFIEVPYIELKSEVPNWFASIGVTDVIMYKIDKQMLKQFQSHKINLFIGVSRNISHEIIKDFVEGKLYSSDTIISEITKEN